MDIFCFIEHVLVTKYTNFISGDKHFVCSSKPIQRDQTTGFAWQTGPRKEVRRLIGSKLSYTYFMY